MYGNLYKYYQQGFEAMINTIKAIYYKSTSRGGAGGEVQSHILQIGHFLLRTMLWNSGHGDKYFQAKYSSTSNEMEENKLFISGV